MRSNGSNGDSGEPEVESLIAFAQDYFAADFPNPESAGCPSPLTLRSLARSGKLPDDELCSHLFGCSECFRAYHAALEASRADAPAPAPVDAVLWWVEWRERLSAALSPKPAIAVARVVILIAISIAVWLAWRGTKKPEAPSVAMRKPESVVTSPDRSSTTETSPTSVTLAAPTPTTPQPRSTNRPSDELIAQVHVKLADYPTLRDVTEAGRGEGKSMKLPASRIQLVIDLPERGVKGLYRVSIVDVDGKTLKTGKERSPDGKNLTIILNLSGLFGKASRLSVGRVGEAPRFYPVTISNSKAASKR